MGLSSTASAALCLRAFVVCFFLTAAAAVSPSSCFPRRTCGDAGISRRDCEVKGCCWDDAIDAGGPRCFKGSDNETCEKLKLRTPCDFAKKRRRDCQGDFPCLQKAESVEKTSLNSEETDANEESEGIVWETEDGYEEIEVIVEMMSMEGYRYIPAENVPGSQNSTSESPTPDAGRQLGTPESQGIDTAEDEGALPSQADSELTDSDEKASESRSAPDLESGQTEELESGAAPGSQEDWTSGVEGTETAGRGDSESDIPGVTKKRLGSTEHHVQVTPEQEVHYVFEWGEYDQIIEEPAAPPSTEIGTELDMPEGIEDMAIESQTAAEKPEDAPSGDELLPKPLAKIIPFQPAKADPDGIVFAGSKSLEETDVEWERKYFEKVKDVDDLEEPFIAVPWAFGSIGAPESMVELELKDMADDRAAASEIQPEAFEDEELIAVSSQTAIEAKAHASEAADSPEPQKSDFQSSEIQMEERIEFFGSQGFVTFVPKSKVTVASQTEELRSVASHQEEDQPTKVFASRASTEHAEEETASDSASLESNPTQSTETTQDVSSLITTEHSPEFIDTPIDFRPTDTEQPPASQEDQIPEEPLVVDSGETNEATDKKPKAKHKTDDHLTNGPRPIPDTSCSSIARTPCGNGRVTRDECRAMGCCWLPLARHFIEVGCYMPQSSLHPTNLDPPHVSV